MSRRRKKSDEGTVELNLSPMIDIVFLLLIFFVVLASQSTPQSLEIQLPSVQGVAEPTTSKPLNIEINSQGQLAIDGEPCSWPSITSILNASPREQVLVFCDRAVPSGTLIRLISSCKTAGAKEVRVVTEDAP
jgi:biopolymer transport protein ExbD